MRHQRNREDRDVRRNDNDDDVRRGNDARRTGSDGMERSAEQGARRAGMNMPGSTSRPSTRSRKKK